MDLLAHGIGGAQDLPISRELVIAGAVAALTVSFTVLALAWRNARFGSAPSRPAPDWLAATVDSRWFRLALRAFGLLLFGYTVFAAVFGQDYLTNPFFGIFYVLLWVWLVPASLLFGPVWKAISPVRTINLAFSKVSGSDPDQGLLNYPSRLGYWPAATGLFAFVWLELVYPYSTELGPVRLWAAAYVAIMLIGGAVFGSRFYEHADPFEVYSTLVGQLSVWGRLEDDERVSPAEESPGRLVVRGPLANLHRVPVKPGLVAVVAVLFGSTAFDSFQDSSFWLQATQGRPNAYLLDNLALLGMCAAVAVLFAVATTLTGVVPGQKRTLLPDLFAHSIVPIIVGYIFAHYLSYGVQYGQTTLIQMSDPLSDGSNYLGTGSWTVNYWLAYHPGFLANAKVLGVVLGHVLGVIAAHDRAVELLPRRHQLTGQLPLLVVMVTFTISGLFLLFAS